MSDSLRSTAKAIHRPRRAALVVLALVQGVAVTAFAPSEVIGPKHGCAMQDSEVRKEECDEMEFLPEGMSIDGCWQCDRDLHFGLSFWCADATWTCTDGENTLVVTATNVIGFC